MNKLKIRLMRCYDAFTRACHLGCGYCGNEVNYLPSGVTVCPACKRRH